MGPRISDEVPILRSTETPTFAQTSQEVRVLLVEDNAINAQIARDLLEDTGLTVDVAENGLVALERVQCLDYAVVFMDVQMPVMDGITATIEMRKDPRLAATPIIAMTANAMKQDREKCIAAGMNDHVAKPIDPDEVYAALVKWLKAGPSRIHRAKESAQEAPNPLNIVGLDSDIGLKRVMGKHDSYRALLRRFADEQANAAVEIRKFMALKQSDDALRIAHSLKSVAGNLGATSISECAARLEEALQGFTGATNIDPLLDTLETALDNLIENLRSQLGPNADGVSYEKSPDPESAEILYRLVKLLTEDDMSSQQYFVRHKERLAPLFSVHGHQIGDFIYGFEFQKALDLILKINAEKESVY